MGILLTRIRQINLLWNREPWPRWCYSNRGSLDMGRCRLQWRRRAGLWGAATSEREAFRAPDNRPVSWVSSGTVANIGQNYSQRVTTKVHLCGDYFVLIFLPHKMFDFSCF